MTAAVSGVELIIAVIRLATAKTRLAPAFNPVARAALVQAMLADTLAAARLHPRSFVSDRHCTGTAALFALGVGLKPSLGRLSGRRHSRSGATQLAGPWPGLHCDVDIATDMTAAIRLGVGPSTRQVLGHLDVSRSD